LPETGGFEADPSYRRKKHIGVHRGKAPKVARSTNEPDAAPEAKAGAP
jgi:hypothetical protein